MVQCSVVWCKQPTLGPRRRIARKKKNLFVRGRLAMDVDRQASKQASEREEVVVVVVVRLACLGSVGCGAGREGLVGLGWFWCVGGFCARTLRACVGGECGFARPLLGAAAVW
jgi:hypothetical protein